jgi:hypothetical protein
VLTLRHSEPSQSPEWTPALSSNYLKLRLAGRFPPNRLVDALCPSDPGRLAEVPPQLRETLALA